jgi:hypothetical protein
MKGQLTKIVLSEKARRKLEQAAGAAPAVSQSELQRRANSTHEFYDFMDYVPVTDNYSETSLVWS